MDPLRILLDRKWWLLAAAIIGAALGFGASLLMDRAYRAEVVMIPVTESSQSSVLASLSNQIGGLSALTGLDLSPDLDRNESFETLRSRSLATRFILENDLVAVLSAGEYPDEAPPEYALNDAIDTLRRSVLSVSEDVRTGIMRVSVTWTDPIVAADWANSYVALANSELRHRAIEDARTKKLFLERALETTSIARLRESIFSLIETQISAEMMASTRPDFAFRIIDAAVPPDLRAYVRPQPAVMAFLGAAFLCSILALVFLWANLRVVRKA